MVLIPFETLLEHLQSSYMIPNGILTRQEGLHYGHICFMLPHYTLQMQHVPFSYFTSMVDDNIFHPPKYQPKDDSGTTAILLVYAMNNELTSIEYIHIRLVIHWAGSQVYEPRSILDYIQYIRDNIKYARQRWEASGGVLKLHSYCMFVVNFGGIMAPMTIPSYCLVYPNIYNSHIPKKEQNHFNSGGVPRGPHIHECICCTLLQCAKTFPNYCQKHHEGCLVISWGAQYENLHSEVIRPCNNQAPLVDFSLGKPFPMVPVGDFQLKDKIFPGSLGDSLLYTHKELDKLQKEVYQVAKHQPPVTPAETSQPPHYTVEAKSSTSRDGEPPKSTGSPDKKSSHAKHSPPTKAHQEQGQVHNQASGEIPKGQGRQQVATQVYGISGTGVLHHMSGEGTPPGRTSPSLLHLLLESPTQQVILLAR